MFLYMAYRVRPPEVWMQKTCEMVTPGLLQGQFTKDPYRHYFRHIPEGWGQPYAHVWSGTGLCD